MTTPLQIESVMDDAGVQEARDRDFDWLAPDAEIHAQVCRELDREARVSRIEAMADHTNVCIGCPVCWSPEIADREAWRGL